MPERTLKVPAEVRNLIRRLHPELKRKVRAALSDILENPGSGKALKEQLEGYWSLPVGRSRIIYRWKQQRRNSGDWAAGHHLRRRTPTNRPRSEEKLTLLDGCFRLVSTLWVNRLVLFAPQFVAMQERTTPFR